MKRLFGRRRKANTTNTSIPSSGTSNLLTHPKDRTHECPIPQPTPSTVPNGWISWRGKIDRNVADDAIATQSQDRRDDPLGLRVLYEPPDRSVDILFIHGLGGSSLRTWCRDRDLNNLWPKHWLPTTSGLSTARILTFGYNAHFMSRKEQVSLNIGDFARDLLFQMKYCENGLERIGQVPIIIVAHSMGGLVIKKAFIDGSQNEEYSDIISSIKAIFFLATPHRGTDLAKTLNSILASSPFGHSPKDYVSQIASRSPTIDDLNESFRHHASKLRTFSFYETLSTNVGPINSLLIVEKQSSVLGYPDEVSQPMNANHHDVCKFKSADDPDYVSFIGALRSVVSTAQPLETDLSLDEDLAQIAKYLNVSGPPDEDLVSSRLKRKEGTCQSFLNCPEFHDWVTNRSRPPILWVHAPPGSGKSTLCGSVVDQLLDEKRDCAYFFFKYEDVKKRSPSYLFYSLAYQMATMIPAYRHELMRLAKSGFLLHDSDVSSSWKRLFMVTLPRIQLRDMVYWVVDALDESESSKEVVDLISSVADFKEQIRVLFFSRPLPIMTKSFQRARRKTPVTEMTATNNENDICLVVADEIDYLLSDDDFKSKIVSEVLKRSQGNFLWVNLVLERIVQCQRQEQVQQVLEATPDGMGRLFDRMLSTIEQVEASEDKELARSLLSWAMYAQEPLTIKQLSESDAIKIKTVMNLKHTVTQICGQFVTIDAYNRVTLVHQSAREYLAKSKARSLSLNPEVAHEELLNRCLAALSDENLREKLEAHETPSFIPYAASSWGFHLENCSGQSEVVANTLIRFFRGPYPLQWIHYLSMSDHLYDMPLISLQLDRWISQWSESETKQLSTRLQSADLSMLVAWSTDLKKLPVNFGIYLSQDPLTIYTCVPAFSPIESALYSYAKNLNMSLSLSGQPNRNWSDCVDRIKVSLPASGRFAVSSSHLAIPVKSLESIVIYDTRHFKQIKKLYTKGRIYCIVFNDSGTLLACTGTTHTWVWEVENWAMKYHGENPDAEVAIKLKFDTSDRLWIITRHGGVCKLLFNEGSREAPSWTRLDSALLASPITAPKPELYSADFNHNHTRIAIACSSYGVSIWNVEPFHMISRLKLQYDRLTKSEQIERPGKVMWHPSGSYVLVMYQFTLVKWTLAHDTWDEVDHGSVPLTDIQCSPNGLVVISLDIRNLIKVYDAARLKIIYVLPSGEGLNFRGGLQFSQDSLRFYSFLDKYCSAWEPDCLRQMYGASGLPTAGYTIRKGLGWKTNDIHNLDPHNFHVIGDQKPRSLECLTVGSTCDQFMAYVHFDGTVGIFDPLQGNKLLLSSGSKPRKLAWNRNQDLLACLGGDEVRVFRITWDSTTGELSAKNVSRINTSKPILEFKSEAQVIFNNTSELLFVNDNGFSQVLNLSGESRSTYAYKDESMPTWWIHNHARPDRLFQVTIDGISAFTWQLHLEKPVYLSKMNPHRFANTASLPGTSLPGTSLPVTSFPSYCEQFLTFVGGFNWLLNHWDITIIPIIDIESDELEEHQTPPQKITLPDSVNKAIWLPFGILPDGRLVFLSPDRWVCTAHVTDPSGTVSSHFFIPHEWVKKNDGRAQTHMLRDGTIVFPLNGEVAMIKSGIASKG